MKTVIGGTEGREGREQLQVERRVPGRRRGVGGEGEEGGHDRRRGDGLQRVRGRRERIKEGRERRGGSRRREHRKRRKGKGLGVGVGRRRRGGFLEVMISFDFWGEPKKARFDRRKITFPLPSQTKPSPSTACCPLPRSHPRLSSRSARPLACSLLNFVLYRPLPLARLMVHSTLFSILYSARWGSKAEKDAALVAAMPTCSPSPFTTPAVS